jgi:hypothetical protein
MTATKMAQDESGLLGRRLGPEGLAEISACNFDAGVVRARGEPPFLLVTVLLGEHFLVVGIGGNVSPSSTAICTPAAIRERWPHALPANWITLLIGALHQGGPASAPPSVPTPEGGPASAPPSEIADASIPSPFHLDGAS